MNREKLIRNARLTKLMKDKKYKNLKKEYFKIEIQYIIDAIKEKKNSLPEDDFKKQEYYSSLLYYSHNPYKFKQTLLYPVLLDLFTKDDLQKHQDEVKEKQNKLLETIKVTEKDIEKAEQEIKNYYQRK